MQHRVSLDMRFLPARRYASTLFAIIACPSVRLSGRPSVTSRYCTKTAKRRISKTTPLDRPMGYRTALFKPKDSSFIKQKISTKFRWDHHIIL